MVYMDGNKAENVVVGKWVGWYREIGVVLV